MSKQNKKKTYKVLHKTIQNLKKKCCIIKIILVKLNYNNHNSKFYLHNFHSQISRFLLPIKKLILRKKVIKKLNRTLIKMKLSIFY